MYTAEQMGEDKLKAGWMTSILWQKITGKKKKEKE